MAWTRAQAKLYLGLPATPDPILDPLIDQVLLETLQAVQGALGRELFLARNTVRFYNVNVEQLQLPRPPIVTIHAIDYAGVSPAGSAFGTGTDNLQIHHKEGWIRSMDFCGRREINVDFEGGFDPLPVDLEQDMWSAFLTRYDEKDQANAGAPPRAGQGSSVISGSGDVSRVTIQDLGTITYDVGATVTASDVADADARLKYGWLAPWARTWDHYRIGPAGGGLGIV